MRKILYKGKPCVIYTEEEHKELIKRINQQNELVKELIEVKE